MQFGMENNIRVMKKMDWDGNTVFIYVIITILVLLIVFAILSLYLAYSIVSRINNSVSEYINNVTDNLSTSFSRPGGVVDFTTCVCGSPNIITCALSLLPTGN